ncbi:MAG TPA: hypothetical protein VH500_15490 [Nitrososphaeraceae archaeon]
MNIAESEQPIKIIAKTCGCKGKGTKITYSFIDTYHSLCIDKKDIISSELEACEILLKRTTDESDRRAIESEITELKMALDLMP